MEQDPWEEGSSGSLLAAYRNLFGETGVPMVKRTAEAIYLAALARHGQATRQISHMAEALQYASKGGIDGYLADMDAFAVLCPECQEPAVYPAIRERIADIRKFI